MNEKTTLLLAKILGGLFLIFGILTFVGALAGLSSAGLAGIGSNYAGRIGQSVGDFPYSYVVAGGLGVLALSVMYFVSVYGLLKQKYWAYIALYVVAVVGLISDFFSLGTLRTMTLIWSVVYAIFAYHLSKTKKFARK